MKITNDFFKEKAALMLRKGYYPYDYIDSFSKFDEEVIPSKTEFYNSLTEAHISDADYEYVSTVWNSFNIKNLGEYHNLYVCSDVLLLADIFENFRNLSMKFYSIDPCHTYTAPGLAWQAALRMSEVKLELLTDPDMHLFIESGIRGGMAMISHRHSKANNPYLADFDESKPSKYILYLDANNLYGWAMSQKLPTHGFEWVDGEIDFMNVSDDSSIGYVLQVDLEYPEDLHELHNDYPLAPERMEVTHDMLSPYSKELVKNFNINPTSTQKLVANLNFKRKYIVHYRNLKQYVAMGLKVTKIHKSIKFYQSPWLKKYIEFNTEQRKLAKSTFEKDLFKLLNNSVFGKTMENLRSRINIELVSNEKRAKKLVSSPAFHSFKIINDNLVSVQRKVTSLLLNRPIYVGFTILDLSKTLMYDFHYI